MRYSPRACADQVNDAGENTIIVVPGANGALGSDNSARLDAVLAKTKVLLLQLEIAMESVIEAAQIARQRAISVIVDHAPVRPLVAGIRYDRGAPL